MKDKSNIFFVLFLLVFITLLGFMFYSLATFEYDPSSITYEPREPLTFEEKEIEVYVENAFRKNYSNVFKEDEYFIETNGNNCHSRLYITKEIYEYIADNLKEPGMVKFTCEVRNGYFEGTTYKDYVIEIKDVIKFAD